MSDILIASLKFPNDPTNNCCPHQMYIASLNGNSIDLYSVSSILGKEKRVYGVDKDNYITITGPECATNGFRVPSFIDCAKAYHIPLTGNANISNLSSRVIDAGLKQRIDQKIADMKAQGKHHVYNITETDFCTWNPKV